MAPRGCARPSATIPSATPGGPSRPWPASAAAPVSVGGPGGAAPSPSSCPPVFLSSCLCVISEWPGLEGTSRIRNLQPLPTQDRQLHISQPIQPGVLPPSPVLRDSTALPSLCLTPSFPHSHPSHTPFHHPAVPPSIRDAAPQGSPASMIPTLVIPPRHDPVLDPTPCHPPFPSPPLPYSQSIRLHPPPPQS